MRNGATECTVPGPFGIGYSAQTSRIPILHALTAADALQLAAALNWSGSPASGDFMTFDDRLRAAASREGFRVA